MSDSNGRQTRSNSRSNAVTLDDIRSLILESESRVRNDIDKVFKRIENIENTLAGIQTEQIRIDIEVENVKEVVTNQQLLLERFEAKNRANNIIITNLTEESVYYSDVHLKKDKEKVDYLCKTAHQKFESDMIKACDRLGKPKAGSNRPLRVTFYDTHDKYQVLNSRKKLNDKIKVTDIFGGKIYMNNDRSYLSRKEDKRLRDKLNNLRSLFPSEELILRSGKIFQNNKIVDEYDIKNQLF